MFSAKQTRLCAVFFIFGASVSLIAAALVRSFSADHGRILEAGWENADHGVSPPPSGRIEAVEIPLANTDGVFPDREQRLAHPKWFFENLSESRLARYFNSCDLRPQELRMLLDKRTW